MCIFIFHYFILLRIDFVVSFNGTVLNAKCSFLLDICHKMHGYNKKKKKLENMFWAKRSENSAEIVSKERKINP